MNFIEKIVLSIQTIRNLPLLFLDYAGILNGDILYTTKKGIMFITRSHTPDLAEVIVVGSGKNYSFSGISKIKNPVIIDLGGGIGDFALFSYYYFYDSNPLIYSFEPDLSNFSYLKKNIYINNADSKIIPANEAVFSSSGEAYLDIHNKSNDQYIVSKKKLPGSLVCKTTTLSNILRKLKISSVYILKMDIEGSEYDLLEDKATLSILNNKVEYVFIEYHDHPSHNYQWIMRQLSNFELIYNEDYVLKFRKK